MMPLGRRCDVTLPLVLHSDVIFFHDPSSSYLLSIHLDHAPSLTHLRHTPHIDYVIDSDFICVCSSYVIHNFKPLRFIPLLAHLLQPPAALFFDKMNRLCAWYEETSLSVGFMSTPSSDKQWRYDCLHICNTSVICSYIERVRAMHHGDILNKRKHTCKATIAS